ncbi:MAG: polysaccharide biosynthesis protein [Clostridiales Family XIII bacterium]|jgi:stage V sporulation protein B|nr:polysaccharide biosynthesis protein [Clostridiales Family XIII bacterium]
MNDKKKSFLSGAAVLGAAGLMVQVLGAIFRIPLANIIGEVGMGYFQTAYPVYIFLLVFSTNGAPAAISKMISERIANGYEHEARRVFKLSFAVMLFFGVIASATVALTAKPLSVLVRSEGSYYSLLAISPALFFVPIMAVFRGYFQGKQEMRPTAVSQLAEQFVRVAVGLGLAGILVSSSLELAAAGACAAASIGPVIGLSVLAFVYMTYETGRKPLSGAQMPNGTRNGVTTRENIEFIKERSGASVQTSPSGPFKEPSFKILKDLAVLTFPTTIGISILPIMNVADMLLCRVRLIDSGFSVIDAETIYGLMSGFASPIINIPMALALSIGLSLIPAVAAANSVGDTEFLKKNISMGFRTAIIIGVPCSFGLMTLAAPILRLIYPSFREEAGNAASYLMILAGGVIFLCVAQTMAGILQGLGKASLPVVSLLAGFILKSVLTYVLTAMPTLNINGATIGSFAGFALIGIMNLFFVIKTANIKFDLMLSVLKPVLSGAIMSFLAAVIYLSCQRIVGDGFATLLGVCGGAAAYCVLILKFQAILAEEIESLPKGKRLVKVLKTLRLL